MAFDSRAITEGTDVQTNTNREVFSAIIKKVLKTVFKLYIELVRLSEQQLYVLAIKGNLPLLPSLH